MQRRFNPTAAQTAVICGFGAAIAASGCLLATVLQVRFAASGLLFRTLLLLPLVGLGATVWILAMKRLKRGIDTDRWPPAEVEALRIKFESSLWHAASIACLFLFCITMVESKTYEGLGLAFLVIGQTTSDLRFAVRRRNVPAPPIGLDWASRPPLHSKHWGEK